MRKIKEKIEYLRQQPEPVRLRAASLLTAASGVVLVIVWLTILLPLQLKLNRGDNATGRQVLIPSPSPLPSSNLLGQPLPPLRSQVAGTVNPTPTPQLPLNNDTRPASPFVPVSPSPLPTALQENTAPVEVE
ncbi:MAG: hypothetical protein WEA04_03350 [Candidatus Andersenbacteria bacterium]